jgi:exosortase
MDNVRHVAFAAYCLFVTIMGWPVLQALYRHSRTDETASHVLLVPAVSVALIVLNRGRVMRTARTEWFLGLVTIAVGLLLGLAWDLSDLQQTVSLRIAVAMLVVLWIGGFVLFYGKAAARAAIFPLIFLGFMLPFPAFVLQPVNNFLRRGSADTVEVIFAITNTPHYREDFLFRLPYQSIYVDDTCSGIRSSIGLFLTTLLAGHLFLNKAWTKTLLVFAIVPITVLKNGVRIATLSLLAIHVDPNILDSALHHDGGIVFFGLALAMLAPLFVILRWSETRRHANRPPPSDSARPQSVAATTG